MIITLYKQAINNQIDLDTRYKLARRLLTISKYERMTKMARRKQPTIIRKIPSEFMPSCVTEEVEAIIRENVGTMTRSKIAASTGLSKYDLNLTIIGLGLSKEIPEKELA